MGPRDPMLSEGILYGPHSPGPLEWAFYPPQCPPVQLA